jgi:hypothetical protein
VEEARRRGVNGIRSRCRFWREKKRKGKRNRSSQIEEVIPRCSTTETKPSKSNKQQKIATKEEEGKFESDRAVTRRKSESSGHGGHREARDGVKESLSVVPACWREVRGFVRGFPREIGNWRTVWRIALKTEFQARTNGEWGL